MKLKLKILLVNIGIIVGLIPLLTAVSCSKSNSSSTNNKLVDKFIEEYNPQFTLTELAKSTLPVKIQDDLLNISKYINFNLNNNQDILVEVENILNANDDLGTLEISLKFSKNDYYSTKNYTISGFNTTSNKNREEITNLIQNINKNGFQLTEWAKDTLPSNIIEWNDILNALQKFNYDNSIKISFLSISNQNNDNGTLDIELEFSKNKFSQKHQFSISGFKTTAMMQGDMFLYNDFRITEDGIIKEYIGNEENITIPGVINLSSRKIVCREIGIALFQFGQNIGDLFIPRHIEIIGQNSFRESSIKTLTFEANSKLKIIDFAAFYRTQLSGKLIIPSSVEIIGGASFWGTSIDSLSFEQNSKLTTISGEAFRMSKIAGELIIPKTVEFIGAWAFQHCKINRLIFQENSSLTTLDTAAFQGNDIRNELIIPRSVTTLMPFSFIGNDQIPKIIVFRDYPNPNSWKEPSVKLEKR